MPDTADLIAKIEATEPIYRYAVERLLDLPGCLDEIRACPRDAVIVATTTPAAIEPGGGVSTCVVFHLPMDALWTEEQMRCAARAWEVLLPVLLTHFGHVFSTWVPAARRASAAGASIALKEGARFDAANLATGEVLTRGAVERTFQRLESTMGGSKPEAN